MSTSTKATRMKASRMKASRMKAPAKKKAAHKRRSGAAAKGDGRGHLGHSSAPASDRSHARTTAEELSWADFDGHVQALAKEAGRRFKPDAVVGIAHGGVFVGGAIASAMRLEFFPVRITRRSRDSGARAHQGISEQMPKDLKGRRVLLVDDVAASGDSLELARRLAKGVGAKAIATAALVKRPEGYTPDLFAQATKSFIVFPWDYQDVVEGGRVDPDTAGA